MAVSSTTRLDLVRWSADTDPVTREQFDTSHENLETFAAKIVSGTSFPTPGAEYEKSFFFKTDTEILYFFNGTDNTGTWEPVNSFGATIQSLVYGGSNVVGTSGAAARADHVHELPDPGPNDLTNYISKAIVDAKGDLIVATQADTVSRVAVGTNNQRLVADSAQTAGVKWVSDTQNTVIDATGDILVGNGADSVTRLAIGSTGTRLTVSGGTAAWVADTQNTVIDAAGDLLVGTANDTVTKLPIGSTGQRLTVSGGTAAWVSDTQNTVIDAKGDLLVGTADNTLVAVPVGSDGYVLTADSNEAAGVAWKSFSQDADTIIGLSCFL